MGAWDRLLDAFSDQPARPVDVRNPNQMAVGSQMMSEYARANADPNYGMLSPELQRLHEDQLARDTLSRTAARGGGGSGYSNDQVRKSIVDFRIQSLAQRQRALDQLRSAMIMAQQPAQQIGTPAQPGIVPNVLRSMGGAAGQRFGEDMFDIKPNQAASQQSGGAPGTTGYRPQDQQQGGMNVNV